MTKDDLETLDDLAILRARFHGAEEAETLNRVAALEAVSFYFGDQWADDIERARRADGRPCFTLNRLPAIVKQVLNEVAANPPAIEIEPEGDGSEDDQAEAVQGLARHVETHSDAELAYGNAFMYMVVGGFASWRITHDYLPQSFDQDCFIEPIWNPFSVYWDPGSKKPDKSDARYCVVTSDLSVEEHQEQFPDSELAGLNDFSGLGDRAPGWLHKDGCRVVEYYTLETEDATLVQLDDGRAVYDDEIPPGARVAVDETGAPISRPDRRRTAYHAISNGLEWLKKREKLATDDIPIVTIYADAMLVDGERRVKGMVEDLMEAQRIFNFNSSSIAETMALGSRANWVAIAEQIEPYLDLWRQSSSRNIAVLPYKNVPGAERPSKITNEPPIQAMSAARQQSADDLRSISGVYDATQSPRGGEESGRAIITRRHQAATGNSNYVKCLGRGVKRTANILLKLFPEIYDTGRVKRILGRDRQNKTIMVHAGRPESLPAMLPDGITGVFDLTVGSYSVTVNVGPSYDTLREETLEMMLALVGAEPALAPLLGDLIVNLMNFSGKQAFVDRLQRALPPALQDRDSQTDPGQLAAQNGQLMQANQKLMAQVQQLSQLIQTKQIEGASREKVAELKVQATAIASAARLESQRIKEKSAILRSSADHQFTAAHDHALEIRKHLHSLMKPPAKSGPAAPAGKRPVTEMEDLALQQ